MFSSVVAFIYIVLCPRNGIFYFETHVKGVRVKKIFRRATFLHKKNRIHSASIIFQLPPLTQHTVVYLTIV